MLRFDGRVAIVTGAGRGLGRAYARLLAGRGASVVVNDVGSSMAGDGADARVAARVVEEIVAAGGTAVADGHDVSTPDGGAALVDAALARFGRVDAVVNNAGIMRWAGMPEVTATHLDDHLGVHVRGSFNTARAAWPHFAAQGCGRVVNTTSAGLFGLPDNVAYATAKAGIVGLTRSLAAAGSKHGIKVNAVAPAAVTRMAGQPDGADPALAPELAAPLVAYLAHEDCPVSGEVYAAGGGRFARIFVACTPGWVDTNATIEDVAAHWAAINDERGYDVPADLPAWSATFLSHLRG